MRKIITFFLIFLLVSLFFVSSSCAENSPFYKVTEYGYGEYRSMLNNAGDTAGYFTTDYTDPETGMSDTWTDTILWDKNNNPTYIGRDYSYTPGYRVYDINNSGQIAGDDYSASIWDKAKGISSIVSPGYSAAINEEGKVVGSYLVDDKARAFIWDKTSGIRDLGSMGGQDTKATDINYSGMVVGVSGSHGFIWDEHNGLRDISVLTGRSDLLYGGTPGLGAPSPVPIKINDAGTLLVNSASDSYIWNKYYGLVDIGSSLTNLNINNSDIIAGTKITGDLEHPWGPVSSLSFAFVWDKDKGILNLNDLLPDFMREGWDLVSVQAINDSGRILAFGYPKGTEWDSVDYRVGGRSFLLDPLVTPEPASMFLFGLGGAGMVLFRKRKRG